MRVSWPDAGRTSMSMRLTPARLLLLFSLVLLPLYAWFYTNVAATYSSPDERTVTVFVDHWAQTNSFLITRPVLSDAVLPRSISIVGDNYAPTGFLGLFLILGLIRRVFGGAGFWLFVPALAAITPFALFTLWRRIFSEHVAFLAAILCAFFPAWAYYASRGFLPNVPFVAFAVVGVALAAKSIEKADWLSRAALFAGGLGVGCALIIRPIEAIWLLPVLGLLWWWSGKSIRVVWTIPGLILPLLWLGYWQEATYGAWYAVGYAPAIASIASETVSTVLWQSLGKAWFPFGFHPGAALQRLTQYALRLYWWALPFALVGLATTLKKASKNTAYKKYSAVFLSVSAYLGLYYGSWSISDHPDPNWLTIGVAYNRYWLPFMVLAMPIIVEGIFALSRKVKTATWVPALCITVLVFASIATTFVAGPDSLWVMASHGVEYTQLQEFVVRQTPADSIVVIGREEKALWPSRQVIYQGDGSFSFVGALPELIKAHQVFWLTAMPANEVLEAEELSFASQALQLTPVDSLGKYTLYSIHF